MIAVVSVPQSLLNAFDAPAMEINCTRRVTTTSAVQALALMNGDFVTAQAGHFARRVLDRAGEDRDRVKLAFRTAFARNPNPGELDRLMTFIHTQEAFYKDKPESERTQRVYADLCQALLGANEFIYLD